METMAAKGKPRQSRPISQSLASQLPPTPSPGIALLPLAQTRKSLGVSCCLSVIISDRPQCQNQHIQSGHRLASLLLPFLTSLFAPTFGYPFSRYGAFSTRSPSSMCTSRSTRWHHGPFGPACTSPFIGTPPLSIPPGQNPRRICSFEPHCLPHWSIRRFRFVARPTFKCIVFLSVGSVREVAGLMSKRWLRAKERGYTEDLKSIDVALDVARRAGLLHLRTERVFRCPL